MKDLFTDSLGFENPAKNDYPADLLKLVKNHFKALAGITLDYFGCDTASHEFKLDDVVFRVLEDEDDGYRSHLGCIAYSDNQSNAIFFDKPVARVKIEAYDELSGTCEDFMPKEVSQGYKLVDDTDGHVWLEFGTANTEDYYPYFVFRHFPKPPGAVIQL